MLYVIQPVEEKGAFKKMCLLLEGKLRQLLKLLSSLQTRETNYQSREFLSRLGSLNSIFQNLLESIL